MECNMMEKHRLQELTLSWGSEDEAEGSCRNFICWHNCDGGSTSKNVSKDDIFESLQPPKNLKVLRIFNYDGIRSPNSMKNLSPQHAKD